MNPTELFHQDGKPAGVWYCTKCRCVSRTKEDADQCCRPYQCEKCGNETRRYILRCDSCRAAEVSRKEEARWQKAQPVPDDYAGWVWDANRDLFFPSADEAITWAEDEGVPTDTLRLYACKKCVPQTDASSVIEHALEEHHEGASYDVSQDEENQLQKFLNDWWIQTGVVSYFPDYERKIVILKR